MGKKYVDFTLELEEFLKISIKIVPIIINTLGIMPQTLEARPVEMKIRGNV